MDKIGFIEDFCSTVLSRQVYITEDLMDSFRISATMIQLDIEGDTDNWDDYSRELAINYVLDKIRMCSEGCREVIEILIVDYCSHDIVH